MKSIRKYKHSKTCPAVAHVEDGDWDSVWAFPVTMWAGKTARRNKTNHVLWLKFVCNSPTSSRCKAELWVKNDDVLAELPKT